MHIGYSSLNNGLEPSADAEEFGKASAFVREMRLKRHYSPGANAWLGRYVSIPWNGIFGNISFPGGFPIFWNL